MSFANLISSVNRTPLIIFNEILKNFIALLTHVLFASRLIFSLYSLAFGYKNVGARYRFSQCKIVNLKNTSQLASIVNHDQRIDF